MEIEKYTEGNRISWNETMPFHNKAMWRVLSEKFKDSNYSYLDETEKTKLKKIGISGKTIAQVCCNNAIELISIVRLGAKEGYGFDISDEAIKHAKGIAAVAKSNCKFIRTDIYHVNEEYYNKFDLIYISAGSLNWLPDIKKFIEIISKMLKIGGVIFVNEIHPFSEIFAPEDNEKFDSKKPYNIINSYFDNSPKICASGIDYLGKQKYKSEPNYWFTHTLSDIFNSCINNSIQLLEFDEYPRDVSAVLDHLQKDGMIPLSFILIGKKIKQ